MYGFAASFLVSYLSFSRGISQFVGFFIVWFIMETVLFIGSRVLFHRLPKHIRTSTLSSYVAFIPSLLQGLLFYLLITVTIFALPTRAVVKETILNSKTGPYFLQFSSFLEGRVKSVFGEAVNETINFLTIRTGSGDTVSLGFQVSADKLSVDEISERQMEELVNKERRLMGLQELQPSEELRAVARSYAREMFENGFFSHTSQVDGSTPATRVTRAGIEYLMVGENLAYAPDVYLAHQGLMNSPGHRANILEKGFGKMGIGVIDGGIYGKIFVQEFSD